MKPDRSNPGASLLRMLSHQWHQYVRRDPTRTLFCAMSNTPRLDRTHGHAVVITAVPRAIAGLKPGVAASLSSPVRGSRFWRARVRCLRPGIIPTPSPSCGTPAATLMCSPRGSERRAVLCRGKRPRPHPPFRQETPAGCGRSAAHCANAPGRCPRSTVEAAELDSANFDRAPPSSQSKKAGSPPASPVIPVTASNAESGIDISGRRYVSARHVASMLGVSLPRTLSAGTRQVPARRRSRSAKRSSTTSASFRNG